MHPLTVDPVGYARLAVAVAVWLTVPGSAVLTLVRHPSRGLGRLALALGLSVAVVPLATLWWSTAAAGWTRGGLLFALAACGAVTLIWGARLWQRRRTDGGSERIAAAIALLIVLAMAIALRASQAVDLVAAPWVDGYHHTLMTQLFIDHGGIPDGYRPYLAVDGFYYHFGFHALAAAIAVVAMAPARLAVLWLGQALNAGASLSTWYLARRLGVSPAASVWAAALPTGLYFFPAYFVSWGRETQLTGLVVLPVALMLLVDAVRPEPAERTLAESILQDIDAPLGPRAVLRVAAAAIAAAGLLLVHYRVMVFYAIGALVLCGWLAGAAWNPDNRMAVRAAFARLAATAVLAVALVSPWLFFHLLPGIRHLRAAAEGWYLGPSGIETVEAWQLTIDQNAFWLGLAAVGVVWAMALRRPAALALGAWLALAVLAVSPPLVGLPRTWMLPPSALLISLFIPVAIGVALFVERCAALGERYARGRGRVPWVVALGAVAVLGVGVAFGDRPGVAARSAVVNPDTVLLAPADIEAMAWVRVNTPGDARFLVGTQHWQFGTYRGIDGGYWLPLLAERQTNVPAALYTYGDPADVRTITALCERVALGDALSAGELTATMADAGADYVYIGALHRPERGFSKERLLLQPDLVQVYAHDEVTIFGRRSLESTAPERTAGGAGQNPSDVVQGSIESNRDVASGDDATNG
ncbi:MAG: DUF6541 family protein [Ardenticatenales bacterium]